MENLETTAEHVCPEHGLRECCECGNAYQPTGPAQKYCTGCGPMIAAAKAAITDRNYLIRRGVKVGVGTGHANPPGPSHPLFGRIVKREGCGGSVLERFRRTAREKVRYGERCGKDLLNAGPYEWAVHHRDHNPKNNPADNSNYELLCKLHHQLEHRCWENLPNWIPSRKAPGIATSPHRQKEAAQAPKAA